MERQIRDRNCPAIHHICVGQPTKYLLLLKIDHSGRGAPVIELGKYLGEEGLGDVRAVADAYGKSSRLVKSQRSSTLLIA